MGKPYASVLIDTYNHEKFIEQAIVSVLEQDFPESEREVIVVDDGSTDGTAEIVRKFAPQVRYIHKPNGGQASAFNAGIPECRGEVVAFLDGDDWWVKEKLARVIPVFTANHDIGAVGHGCLMVDADGVLRSTVVPDRTYRLSLKSVAEARLFTQLRPFFGTSKVAYRKAILDRILPVPDGAIIEADEFLFTAAPCLADVIALDQPLFCYRLHSGNQFMLQNLEEKGQRRKYGSMACLLEHLPGKMRSLGIADEIIHTVLAPLSIEVELLRLQLDGGSRWDMLRAERSAYKLEYKSAPLGYRIFKQFALLMTLAMPPKRFFRLKRWYATSSLRSLRRRIGEPVGAAPIAGGDARQVSGAMTRRDQQVARGHR